MPRHTRAAKTRFYAKEQKMALRRLEKCWEHTKTLLDVRMDKKEFDVGDLSIILCLITKSPVEYLQDFI
jgi:hypothetical protein